ncbi:BMC domain-containing protein [Clostridium boliviensis]|uniref:BMC domain-containing protein n=1 Tax=Clostridium boliviensis TaxID=318465 RepID=A0ABU4GP80_9CLOT|nr:BMC domain-containing protein [Clostridium boliviensis]MDW2798042.1 BMC domain-containing protein [Clostridium boliviensis]
MKDEALGLIEVIGLLAAVEAADTGLKSANVSLVGIENATGAYFTVKFCGDVGAVKAAVTSARVNAEKVGTVVSAHVIPRLSAGLKGWLMTEESAKVEEATQVESSEKPAEEKEKIADSESENEKNPAYTCNLCKDPKCPREKGQMEKLCIHARGKRGNGT